MFSEAAFSIAALEQLNEHQPTTSLVLALCPAGSLLLLAVLLFIFSIPLGHRLASTISEESANPPSFEETQSIAFAAAGIVILAIALPNIGRACESLYS
jgi:hypothetical protein